MGKTIYWLDWYDDSGNPADNIELTASTPLGLVGELLREAPNLADHVLDSSKVLARIAALPLGRSVPELELANGRFFFGVVADSEVTT